MAWLACAAAPTVILSACGHQASPTSLTSPTGVTNPAATASARPVQERPLGIFTVTCHTGTGRTASGRLDGPGLAAVDPDVLPLGTRVRVEKVGVVTAADRGSAVDHRSLDVWAPSAAACAAFGRQRLQVWRVS